MRLLLIRHGETIHNVAGVYAGTTDSPLTNHGVLQANRLGSHLSSAGFKVVDIFSSDLQRAFLTADAIRDAQDLTSPPLTKLKILREQDYGSWEGKPFLDRPRFASREAQNAYIESRRGEPGFKDIESKESMRHRMENFFDEYLSPKLLSVQDDHTVVIVAHGIILSQLWRVILRRFASENISVTPQIEAVERGFSLEYIGAWSNTGYLELEINPKNKKTLGSPQPDLEKNATPSQSTVPAILEGSAAIDFAVSNSTGTERPLPPPPTLVTSPPNSSPKPNVEQSSHKHLDMSLAVIAVNCQTHLKGLKKTRGGIGSLAHDANQKTMDYYFKRRRIT